MGRTEHAGAHTGRRTAASLRVLVAVILTLVVSDCGGPDEDKGTGLWSRHPKGYEFLAVHDPPSWISIYNPERSASGYNLALFWSRVPVLFDMNGRVVHAWPEARVKSRVKLLANGNLLGLARGRSLVEYDWDGNLVWERAFDGMFPHHDLERLANGNTLTIVLRDGERADDLVEVDPAGEVVWEWRALEGLAAYFPDPLPEGGELTHMNSVQSLPENPWFAAGDERFRPGNVLVSARNRNAVFVVDKATKEVVWFFDRDLDRQHEARMIPLGEPGAGTVQIFDNGLNNRVRYRQSAILEIDPVTEEIVWRYDAEEFFSPTAGVGQRLPGGNTVIASSRSGRLFEIDRHGDTVWQWEPLFDPVRPSRYPYDYAPQLAALRAPSERAVEPSPGYRYTDRRIYGFMESYGLIDVRIDGVEMQVLKDKKACRRLLVPEGAQLALGYGVNRRGLTKRGIAAYRAVFQATVQEGDETAGAVFEDVLGLEPEPEGGAALETKGRATVDLAAFAHRWVELCVAVEEEGPDGRAPAFFGYWHNPAVTSAGERRRRRELERAQAAVETSDDAETPDEAETRRRQLQAHGYVN